MLFLTFFLLFIVVGYPVWDYFYMKKVMQIPKWRMYLHVMIVQWILVAVLFIFWHYTNREFSNLFVYDYPFLSTSSSEILKSVALGALIGMFVMMVVVIVFSKSFREKFSEALSDESIQFLLPKTAGERLLFLFVSITAGVCEEIIFRGLMVYYFINLPMNLPVVVIGIITSLLFGIIHLYQGWKGVLQTAYIGGILFFLYVGTGSLLIPIILHFIIDVKFVFLPNKSN